MSNSCSKFISRTVLRCISRQSSSETEIGLNRLGQAITRRSNIQQTANTTSLIRTSTIQNFPFQNYSFQTSKFQYSNPFCKRICVLGATSFSNEQSNDTIVTMSRNGLFCITESFHFNNFNLIKYDMIKDSDACMIICSSLKPVIELYYIILT